MCSSCVLDPWLDFAHPPVCIDFAKLRRRGVISDDFVRRFQRQNTNDDDIECPAKCGRFLLPPDGTVETAEDEEEGFVCVS